ncbi:MAG: glucose-1-phosphate cytidylyltransferase [Halobacteriovorax sp.]|nr:glucose-1-phosphate cytidylyltransferase [Halobacteriovorax sp.]|tara:strand:- start:1106 stop:1876 length:771 start_codon:yes stop_codon:yes gene_type:complete
MKVVILAGGYGTRISEESDFKPKPMIDIGGKPIIWHIMKHYSSYGFNEFVLLLGYKSYVIKEYFANYYLHNSDVTIDTAKKSIEVHNNYSENWKITLLETGLDTMTGGRVKRAKDYIGNEPFFLTYGDGVSDVNIKDLLKFHKEHGKKLTMTAIQPEGKFGALKIEDTNKVSSFLEKPKGDGAWINGGFFVCEPSVIDTIEGDTTVFEKQPLESLAKSGELYSYKHHGFWKCMDTLRDKNHLNEMWSSASAPWKTW